jgi:cytochrome c
MMPTLGLLTPPPTVYPPTQADNGAQTYFYFCLVCHGDRGQGLTEWRKLLDPPDNNCFQAKCHAPNLVVGAFTFPHDVPPVIGPGVLRQFVNAQRLHDFISKYMPYQAPGMLKPDQYWDLTAYLMRANGVEPPQPLDNSNASSISFAPQVKTIGPRTLFPVTVWVIAIVLVVSLLAVGVFLVRRRLL